MKGACRATALPIPAAKPARSPPVEQWPFLSPQCGADAVGQTAMEGRDAVEILAGQ